MTPTMPPDDPLAGVAEETRQLAARPRPDLGRLADIRIPDSAAAAEAERLARAESSPMLYAHALRSYFYAALLAARDGMDYDQELLYVGCVLHDIGLTPRFADPLRPFEHVSADTCAELAERHGWALGRRYRLHRPWSCTWPQPFRRPRKPRSSCWGRAWPATSPAPAARR